MFICSVSSPTLYTPKRRLFLNYALQIKKTSTVPPRGCSVASWVLWYSKMFEEQIIEENQNNRKQTEQICLKKWKPSFPLPKSA